jgi:hypothetical protein
MKHESPRRTEAWSPQPVWRFIVPAVLALGAGTLYRDGSLYGFQVLYAAASLSWIAAAAAPGPGPSLRMTLVWAPAVPLLVAFVRMLGLPSGEGKIDNLTLWTPMLVSGLVGCAMGALIIALTRRSGALNQRRP